MLPYTEAGKIRDVVWIIRLPRLLLSMSVGIGLAICGVIMQAVVKNPLAEPYTLGISSGASLGATVAILMGIGTMFGSNYVGVMAFLGCIRHLTCRRRHRQLRRSRHFGQAAPGRYGAQLHLQCLFELHRLLCA